MWVSAAATSLLKALPSHRHDGPLCALRVLCGEKLFLATRTGIHALAWPAASLSEAVTRPLIT